MPAGIRESFQLNRALNLEKVKKKKKKINCFNSTYALCYKLESLVYSFEASPSGSIKSLLLLNDFTELSLRDNLLHLNII